MPRATYNYVVDLAGTQFQTDLIARGLAAADEPATYDVTNYVLETSINRGRESELEAFGAGTMTLLLDNSDRRFTPDYGSSPLYPYFRVGTMIRARVPVIDYTDLASWWSLEENTGSTRYDSYGTNHLSDKDSVEQSAGKFGHSAGFNLHTAALDSPDILARGLADAETEQQLWIASNATLQPVAGKGLWLGAWVNFTDVSTDQYIIAKWSPATSNAQYALRLTSGFAQFVISEDGTTISTPTAQSSVTIAAGVWYLIQGWYDQAAGTINIQVNETLDSVSLPIVGAYTTGSSNFLISGWRGRFNPANLLYGYVDQAFLFRRTPTSADLAAMWNSGDGIGFYPRASGGYAPLFTGYIKRITPQMDDSQQTVTVECTDLSERMGMALVSSGLHQSKSTGELVRRLLSDGISWRLDWTDIATGQDTVSYAWWRNENLTDALRGVEASEWGQFYVDARGYPVFADRNARGTAAANTGTVVGDDDVASAELAQELDDVFNEVRIQAHPRVTQGKAIQIWRLRETITLQANATQTLVAEYSDPVTNQSAPALNVVTPVATTDYSANTVATGGTVTAVNVSTAGTQYDINNPPKVSISGGGGYGAEAIAEVAASGAIAGYTVVAGGGGYTSAPAVTVEANTLGTPATATATVNVGTDATSSLTVTAQFANFGESAQILLQNTSGGTIYVPYLRLRGDPLMEPDTVPAITSDGESQALYLKRTMEIDQPWQQSTTQAATIAATLLGRYKAPKSRVNISLVNWDSYLVWLLTNIELDDMLSLSLQRAGLASVNYFIGAIRHTITEGGRVHQAQLVLERSRTDGGGVYNTAVFDTAVYS